MITSTSGKVNKETIRAGHLSKVKLTVVRNELFRKALFGFPLKSALKIIKKGKEGNDWTV